MQTDRQTDRHVVYARYMKPTLIERFPLVQSAHERLIVVGKTLNSSDVSAGWRTGLRKRPLHTCLTFSRRTQETHIFHCHTLKLMIKSCCFLLELSQHCACNLDNSR